MTGIRRRSTSSRTGARLRHSTRETRDGGHRHWARRTSATRIRAAFAISPIPGQRGALRPTLRDMPDEVLLTGATGFLGGYLAGELLRQTSSTVLCLVRGRSRSGAEQRFRAGSDRIGLPRSDRLKVVHGNLLDPHFGLSPDEYTRLCHRITAIYHCAASVNLAADFTELAPTNIDGTRAVLALATHDGRRIPVHLVSTQGVFINARAEGLDAIDEATAVRPDYAGGIGYTRTKSEAEALARAWNTPVTFYRPGIILGHSATGRCADNDFVARLLRAVIRLGAAPECDGDTTVSTVDDTARMVVALSRQPDTANRAFHLTQADHLAFGEVFEHVRALGYPLRSCGLAEWRRLLFDEMHSPDAFVMLAVWKVAEHLLATKPHHRIPRVDSSATRGRVALELRTLDRGFFARMIDHLVTRGVLPPVPAPASPR
ncbi:thioester reductase domain-containing protein [Nocardiopsis gilva]|uniref:thioester reductase domain-containing protein n=1 Tax=Nocardiopsis gilva TaxID=280236 RepID=UPI0012FE1582|nr:thioester reductase domain-containing protein [Nocardiopsis gilva]